MIFDDLTKALESVLDLFLDWFAACRNPLKAFDQLTSLGSESAKLRGSLRLWFTSFIITLILQFPLLKIIGIEWGNLGFQLPSFLLLTAFLVLGGVLLHGGLRLYGIPSDLGSTIAGYTPFACIYNPFIAVLNYPSFLKILLSLRTSKAEHASFGQAVSFVIAQSSVPIGRLSETSLTILAIVETVGSFVMLAILAQKLSNLYLVSKVKVLSAFGFSMSVLMPPLLVAIAAAYFFTLYVFMSV